MLIPKIINLSILIIFLFLSFSILFFFLGKLPKASIEITYKPIYKPSIPIFLCQVLINSELKECLKNILTENCEIKIKNIMPDGSEIVIENHPIRKASQNAVFSEVYRCKFLDNNQIKEIIIKLV